jgi:hypothetical protein
MEIVSLTCPGAVTDYPFLMYLYKNSRKLYLVSLLYYTNVVVSIRIGFSFSIRNWIRI